MEVHLVVQSNYERRLQEIEDFVFDQAQSFEALMEFFEAHCEALGFLEANPFTPAIHPVTKDQSWVFYHGRYRIFFRAVKNDSATFLYLLDIIDNRRANQHVYPENTLPTYEDK